MKSLQKHERTECRRLLRNVATKYPHEPKIVDRAKKAAEYLDPQASYPGPYVGPYPESYRQGESDSPGHVVYWISSSEKYSGQLDEEKHKAPPFYRVRLGANGDDHCCTCKDFSNGAPELGGKHYCKHIMAAHTLEYLREHPAKRPGGIRNEIELISLEQQAAEAGIDTSLPEVRQQMIKHPDEMLRKIRRLKNLPDMEMEAAA